MNYLITFIITFLGSYSYSRAGGASLETGFFVGVGVGCSVLTAHRIVAKIVQLSK